MSGYDYRSVFLIGAPRSGTTWLQRMLGAHNQIATSQETDLFAGYIAPWVARWDRQVDLASVARNRGMPSVLTAAEFNELLQHAVQRVYGKVASLKPGAAVVLDKSPESSSHVPLIDRLLPDARFLHILRDGRDVAASMVAASRGWGSHWAPGSTGGAAYRWQRYVTAIRSASLPPHRYLEVRYEDLLERGPEVLQRCLAFCGVQSSSTLSSSLYDAFRLRGGSEGAGTAPDPLLWSGQVMAGADVPPTEPPGFLRKGVAGTWRSEWTARDRLAFDHMAGELLIGLGYEPDRAWAQAGLSTTVAFTSTRVMRGAWRRLQTLRVNSR